MKKFGYRYDILKMFVWKNVIGGFNLFFLIIDFFWLYLCNILFCWMKFYSNFWEVFINVLWDYKKVYLCFIVDGCYNWLDMEEDVWEFIMMNFKNFYNGNRVFFGFYMMGNFFCYVFFYCVMDCFIKEVLMLFDVYIILIFKMLDWME